LCYAEIFPSRLLALGTYPETAFEEVGPIGTMSLLSDIGELPNPDCSWMTGRLHIDEFFTRHPSSISANGPNRPSLCNWAIGSL
jgi:hypothetical protein